MWASMIMGLIEPLLMGGTTTIQNFSGMKEFIQMFFNHLNS